MPTYAESGYPRFSDPEIVARITPIGYEPLYGALAKAATLYRNDIAKWHAMIEAIGLHIE